MLAAHCHWAACSATRHTHATADRSADIGVVHPLVRQAGRAHHTPTQAAVVRGVEEGEGDVAVHTLRDAIGGEKDALVAEIDLVSFDHMGLIHRLTHSKPKA